MSQSVGGYVWADISYNGLRDAGEAGLAAEGAAFTGRKGQLVWIQEDLAGTQRDKTVLMGDINGDKRADFHIELTGLKVLTAADFVL